MDAIPPPPPPSAVAGDQLAPLCSLDDPTRRRLYDYVVARDAPVGRDRTSTDLGLDRSTVAYHLDKLVEEGLLVASFARPEGRGGPGAGRPTKYYARSDREFAVSVPPRDYRLAAELLARAVETDPSGVVRGALHRAAEDLGRAFAGEGSGTGAPSLLAHLAQQGFEPYEDDGVVRLRNCPFHRLAREHTELVCGMNLAMLASATRAFGADFAPVLEPDEDRCCVAFHPTDRA